MAPPSRRRQLAFATSAVLLVLLSTGLLAEGMIRVVAGVSVEFEKKLRPYDLGAILVKPHGVVGFRAKPGAVFEYRNGTRAHLNARGFRGPAPTLHKGDGTIRIVLLGGSTTFGWGVNDGETIDAHLRAILDTMAPQRRFEVINAALDGYDSHQLLERVRGDALSLEPDVLIINTGINDVRAARLTGLVDADPRTLYWEGPMRRMREEQDRGTPYLASRIKHASFLVRFVGLTRDAILRSARGGVPKDVTRYPVYPDAADYFERNVRAMVRFATERGIVAVLSTPPSSLRLNYAPTSTSTIGYWLNDAEETAVYRDTLAGRLRAIADQFVAE